MSQSFKDEIIKMAEHSDIVSVENSIIGQVYFAEVSICFDEDDESFEGIFFDGECIIDDSNINQVNRVHHNIYTLNVGEEYIVFTFYTETQI